MRFLVFQHLDIEHPGIFRQYFRAHGIAWDTVDLDRGQTIPDLGRYDALAIFGGPMDVWEDERYPWLIAEKAAIQTWVAELGRPYLGVCLGHQLLAAALGGKVAKMPVPEVGIVDILLTEAGSADPLMQGIPANTQALQWHGAEVTALPIGGLALARNMSCSIQAFRVGAHAYGLQYHVEVEPDTVNLWSNVPEYAAALAQLLGPDGGAELARCVQQKMLHLNQIASIICGNFQRIVARRHIPAAAHAE